MNSKYVLVEAMGMKNMIIDRDINKYEEDIVRLSLEGYQKEFKSLKFLPEKSISAYQQYLLNQLKDMKGLVCLEDGRCIAYLLYGIWEEASDLYCSIPEWGYGAAAESREKAIGYLFQVLAEALVNDKAVNFSIQIYAHDIEIQRLFSYMQFGMQAETGIRLLEKADNLSNIKISELTKEDIVNRWNEIWGLLDKLINHLKLSPVFYPGEEFTEEVYREFFEDAGTRLFVAEEGHEMIGLIEANADSIPLIFSDNEAANVGEAYVLPEYRGQNIAQALLNYVSEALLQDKYHYAWVEHGTANPNARYFWNKYFTTYKYEMVRKICP